MKFRYDKENDAMMIWLSNDPVDYAKQKKNVIIHFSRNNKPMLIEVLDAMKFAKDYTKVFPVNLRKGILRSV